MLYFINQEILHKRRVDLDGQRNDGQREICSESSRCIYENDEIIVSHSFMSYPDDTREAVMLVAMIKDGKVIRMETGATSLD